MSRFESITIREVESSDLETFYEHQLDPEAIRIGRITLNSHQRQRPLIQVSSHGLAPLSIFPKFRSSALSPARVSSLTLGRFDHETFSTLHLLPRSTRFDIAFHRCSRVRI